uniref:ORF10 n=1 Tax=Cnaphalocrocis medinalis granulovirus TaxID=1750712 RepID=A0A109WVD8_9BBAC|nr:ORF10 [Cnaphalocrocis medinalis granulovirus]
MDIMLLLLYSLCNLMYIQFYSHSQSLENFLNCHSTHFYTHDFINLYGIITFY